MKNFKKYSGVITPMLTPVTSDGQIDFKSVEKLLNYIIDAGTFPFALGTTGELSSVTDKNRNKYVKQVAEYLNGKTTFYAGISDNRVENTIEVTKTYSDYGVDICVLHLPHFFPLTHDLMSAYFEKIADASPIPIIIYNIAALTHMSIPLDIIEKLSSHPIIAGIKDSGRDWNHHVSLAEKFKDREDFSLFIGWTGKSAEALSIGFDGIVPNTANIVPQLFKSLYNAAIKGDKETALKYQTQADELGNLVQANKTMTQTIPELKSLMDNINICKPFVLPPLEKLDKQDSERLIKNFHDLGL